jgi:hypothetical protein
LLHVITEASRVSAVAKLAVDKRGLYFIMYGERYKHYSFVWLNELQAIVK